MKHFYICALALTITIEFELMVSMRSAFYSIIVTRAMENYVNLKNKKAK